MPAMSDPEPARAAPGAAEPAAGVGAANLDGEAALGSGAYSGDANGADGIAGAGTRMNVTVEGNTEDLTVAETINNLFLAERPRLNRGHFERYDIKTVIDQARDLVADPGTVQECTAVLHRGHLLFLTGDAESGKATLARRLAAELQGPHPCTELWLCRHGPDRNVEVRVEDLASKSYRQRMVVFREPLEHENTDLDRFIRELGEERLAEIARRLAEVSSFLVFTAETGKLAGAEARLRGLGVLVEVRPLHPDLLREGLERLAGRLQLTDRSEVERLLARSGQRIVEHLKTIPRVARFVHETLADVAHGRVDLEAALSRADSLESWFLQDLQETVEGFDAWCYCLALVLCHAANRSESLPWIEFDALHRALKRFLESHLRIARAPRNAHTLCRENALCRAARAEIDKPEFPEACSIRFRQASYPAQLWRVLLGPGRALLGMLRPLLAALGQAEEPYCRILAAQITGRIGELDPNRLVLPLLGRDGTALGPLFQGILASEDTRYRAHCMSGLRKIECGAGAARATGAVRALVDIGRVDFEAALCELCAVCASELAPRISWESLGPAIARLEDDARVDTAAVRTLGNIKLGNLRQLLAQALPPRCVQLLDAVRFSLVGLCLYRGPVQVLSRLRAYEADDEAALGRLFALVFLHSTGVFAYLEILSPSAGTEVCNLMLASAAALEDTAELARFLTWAHVSLGALPGALRQGLRGRLLALVKDWLRQGVRDEELRQTVLRLLRHLLAAESGDLRSEILHLLRRDPDLARPDSDLKALAVEAITGEPAPGERP
jgi:hypothetical protein